MNLDDKVYKILIVDDEKDELDSLSMTLQNAEQFKTKIKTATNSDLALSELKKHKYDLVISDFRMPNLDGIELLNVIKVKYPDTLRMLITGYPDIDVTKKAINKAEIHHFIEKPWYTDDLISAIQGALKKRSKTESSNSTGVDNVEQALNLVNDAQKKLLEIKQKAGPKRIMLEFSSQAEFNKFFFKIKHRKNISIEDIHIFENKYVIKLSVYRKSYDKIK